MPVNEIIHADCLETIERDVSMLPDLYLVRVRHSMDDMPVFITDSETEALEFARETSFNPSRDVEYATNSPDCSTPVVIDVVRFADGRPVETTVVRSFEDEPV